MGRPREAVDAAMLAAAVRIDRAIEADVGRIVAGDHLSSRVERHRGLERRQLVEALPAIVEGDPGFRLVAAAGIGLRATAAPALTFDDDPKFGKRRRRTRRLGGRRDRRVLEDGRGCSAHDSTIAWYENKSRTTTRLPCQGSTAIAAKSCNPAGCFECDKVLTVRRLALPRYPKAVHAERDHSDRRRRATCRGHAGSAGAGGGGGRDSRGARS